MDSGYLQPCVPLCGVFSGWLCSSNTNHSCSQNGLLYMTLVILFLPVALKLGMVTILQLLILSYSITSCVSPTPTSSNTLVNILHIKSSSRLSLIWMSCRGGHLEDVTTGWPMSQGTWAMGGSWQTSLGMYIVPTLPTAKAIFKDAALRGQCVVETIWTAYLTEPR